MDMSDPRITTLGGCYHHYCSYNNKSKRLLSGLGSHDPKYYDQIITKVNIQARKQQHERSLLQDQTTAISSDGSKKKKRVLVVDDEPDICMVYQIVLEDAGYQCIPYTDPVKALQEFKPYYYDLILLDIKMPVLNGFELCKKIIELDKAVHIIFITALDKFRTQHFPELGKINYVQKPVSNEQLVQIVDMIVGNSMTID
jgi:CheY-like chemotaxis protein